MADNSHEKYEALEAEAVCFAESIKEDAGSAPPTMMEPFYSIVWKVPCDAPRCCHPASRPLTPWRTPSEGELYLRGKINKIELSSSLGNCLMLPVLGSGGNEIILHLSLLKKFPVV